MLAISPYTKITAQIDTLKGLTDSTMKIQQVQSAKMEQGQKNYISYIMQDAMYNVYLFDEIINASIRIVQTAHDILSARLTITNMLLSCLKSANPEIKGQLVNSVITELRDDILGSAEVKECMLDAARISHVIMLQ